MIRRLAQRRSVRVALGFATVALVVVAAANLWLVVSERGDATSDVAKVRHAQAAIVPGALVQPDGRMSGMLADRVRGALALYRAGKVDRILVSGDHTRRDYDETDTMRDALLRAGVPARAVFTDYAGVDTWATMVRARKVFGVRSAVVVTQGFHMARALYLAGAAGLSAQGLTSDGHGYGAQGRRSDAREVVARVKGLEQATARPHVLLGPSHPITGDGRLSWDPSASAPRAPGLAAPVRP